MRTFELSYKAIGEFLSKGRNKTCRWLSRNTKVCETVDGKEKVYAVVLYATRIVTYFANGDIRLGCDGWRSQTTICRLNEFAPKASVGSNRGVYILCTKKGTFHFEDGCIIKPDGSNNCQPLDEYLAEVRAERAKITVARRKWRTTKARIDKFTQGYLKAFWGRKLTSGSKLSIIKMMENHVYDSLVLNRLIEKGWVFTVSAGYEKGQKHNMAISDLTKKVALALQDKEDQKVLTAENEESVSRELSEVFRHLLFDAYKLDLNCPHY